MMPFNEAVARTEYREALALAELTWAQRKRVQWINEMLDVYGFINRKHIMRKFDVSEPQASKDFTMFLTIFPHRATYDKNTKQYKRDIPK